MRRHLPLGFLLLGFGSLYLFTVDSHGMFLWDESEYAGLGRNLVRGEPYHSSFRPPLLPLCVAATIAVSGRQEEGVLKIPVVLFALLGIALVSRVVARESGPVTGWVAGGCLAMMPTYWQHTSYLLTEVPFLVVFAAACFFFVFGLYGDNRWFYAAWIATGLAFLTRYTCVLLGPLFVLFLGLATWLDREALKRSLKSRAFWLAPFLGLLVQLPWLVRQQLAYGDVLHGFRYASGQLLWYMPEASFPAHTYLVALPAMLTWPVGLLALAGFGWSIWKRHPFGLHCLLVAVFLLAWFSAYRYKELRLITALLPFMAVGAGLGYGQVLPRVGKLFGKAWCAALVVSVLTGYSYFLTAPYFQHTVARGYPSLVEACRQLRPRLSEGDVVMTASVPQMAWYLDCETVGFPSRETLSARLDEVDWVAVVNYEPGQPDYVKDLVRRHYVQEKDLSPYVLVEDPSRHFTFIVPAHDLKTRLQAE